MAGINPVQHSEGRSGSKAKRASKGINPVQHSEGRSGSKAKKAKAGKKPPKSKKR